MISCSFCAHVGLCVPPWFVCTCACISKNMAGVFIFSISTKCRRGFVGPVWCVRPCLKCYGYFKLRFSQCCRHSLFWRFSNLCMSVFHHVCPDFSEFSFAIWAIVVPGSSPFQIQTCTGTVVISFNPASKSIFAGLGMPCVAWNIGICPVRSLRYSWSLNVECWLELLKTKIVDRDTLHTQCKNTNTQLHNHEYNQADAQQHHSLSKAKPKLKHNESNTHSTHKNAPTKTHTHTRELTDTTSNRQSHKETQTHQTDTPPQIHKRTHT